MDNKFIGLFIALFIVIFAMGSVNASNLVDHNFDNYFSMKIPDGVNFEKEDSSENDLISVSYSNDEIVIVYTDGPMYSEKSYDFFMSSILGSVFPDLDQYYESQEGNLKIFEPTMTSDEYLPMVGTYSGNKLVIIFGPDVNQLKEMGNSIEFN